MKEITLTLKIITPLFMGGAEQQPELRTQSIKGILRWWWRFLHSDKNLSDLKREEAKIFGGYIVENNEKVAIASKVKLEWINFNNLNKSSSYLCMNDRRTPQQPHSKDYSKIKKLAFNESQSFSLKVSFLSIDTNNHTEENFNKAIKLLHYFGGIGGRWRRGFGSIMVEEIMNEDSNIKTLDELRDKIKKLFPITSNNTNNYMGITNTSIFFIKPNDRFWSTWEKAMNELRDNFYRPLKVFLKLSSIGSFNPRKASPLIIQIKRLNNNNFY
jgi:CRISPR-associated protein Cmr1